MERHTASGNDGMNEKEKKNMGVANTVLRQPSFIPDVPKREVTPKQVRCLIICQKMEQHNRHNRQHARCCSRRRTD